MSLQASTRRIRCVSLPFAHRENELCSENGNLLRLLRQGTLELLDAGVGCVRGLRKREQTAQTTSGRRRFGTIKKYKIKLLPSHHGLRAGRPPRLGDARRAGPSAACPHAPGRPGEDIEDRAVRLLVPLLGASALAGGRGPAGVICGGRRAFSGGVTAARSRRGAFATSRWPRRFLPPACLGGSTDRRSTQAEPPLQGLTWSQGPLGV